MEVMKLHSSGWGTLFFAKGQLDISKNSWAKENYQLRNWSAIDLSSFEYSCNCLVRARPNDFGSLKMAHGLDISYLSLNFVRKYFKVFPFCLTKGHWVVALKRDL